MPDLDKKTEAEQLADLAMLPGAIVRKVAVRADQDPAAAELLDLTMKAEAVAGELLKRKMN